MYKKSYSPISDTNFVTSLNELKDALNGSWASSGSILNHNNLAEDKFDITILGNKIDVKNGNTSETLDIIDINTIRNPNVITSNSHKCAKREFLEGTVYKGLIKWSNGIIWIKLKEDDCYCPPCDDCYCPPNKCDDLVFSFSDCMMRTKSTKSECAKMCNGGYMKICSDCEPCNGILKCPSKKCASVKCGEPFTVELTVCDVNDRINFHKLKQNFERMTNEQRDLVMQKMLMMLS